MEAVKVANGNQPREHAPTGSLFANPRFDHTLPRRREDSYREQLQVHRGDGRKHALRLRIQVGKNLVRPAEVVWIASGAGVIQSQPGRGRRNGPLRVAWKYQRKF